MQIGFYEALSQSGTYELLFPDRSSGLVIAWLYQKMEDGHFPDRSFREKDIHDAFKRLFPSERYPKEFRTDSISRLSEYFLRYDNKSRLYTFKGYALEFCERAYDIIKRNWELTDIEKLCHNLREKLEGCQKDDDLNYWLDTDFPAYKGDLTGQLDFLERQILQVVSELRLQISARETAMQQVLERVIDQLEDLKRQSRELSKAFSELNIMRTLLNEFLNKTDDSALALKILEVIRTINDLYRDLSVVDSRIDRVQPRVKQLFFLFTKPLIASKIEFFLQHLLQNSHLKRDNTGKRKLSLPEEMPSFVLHEEIANFTIVEKRNPFPQKPAPMPIAVEDPKLREAAFAPLLARIYDQKVVSELFMDFKQLADQQRVTHFAPFFFRVLNAKEYGFKIAVWLAYKVLLHFSKLPNYSVQIDQVPIANPTNPQITICQMTIYKN